MAINRAKVSRDAEKFVRQGRLDEAISQYRKLLSDSPNDLVTLNKIGDLYRQAGQVPRAVASFKRIAEHYRDRGFGQKAIAMFKKVAKLDEEDAASREALAGLYSDAGLTRDALHNLREAAALLSQAGDTERALELESRALELCPDDWSGLQSQAERLQRSGETDRAVATYLRAAAGMAGSGDLDGAVDCCREAVAAAPLDPEPVAYMVRLLVEHDRGDAAVAELQARIGEEDAPHLQALLGETLLATGDLDAASRALENASGSAFAAGDVGYRLSVLRLDLLSGRMTQMAESLAHVVNLMREVNDTDGAVALLMEVNQHAPDLVLATGLLVNLFRHEKVAPRVAEPALDLLVGVLSPEESGDDLSFILGLLGDLRPGDETLARRLAEAGTAASVAATAEADAGPDHVEVEGEDGSEVDPEFVNEHLVEADVFIKYGLMAKAAAHLSRIVEKYPRTLVANQRLMEIYEETGQVESLVMQAIPLAEIHRQRGEMSEARQVLTRAQAAQPDNQSLGSILNALAADRPLPAYRSPHAPVATAAVPAPSSPQPPQALEPPSADELDEPADTVVVEEAAPPAPPEPLQAPAADAGEEEILDLQLDADLISDDLPATGTSGHEPTPSAPVKPAATAAPAEPAAAAAPAGETDSPEEDEQDVPSPSPDEAPAPVKQAAAGDDFFDLAEAIERELSAEEGESEAGPVVDDGEGAGDTVGGIREAIQQQVGSEDHQTHYQLGIAFKEMGLLDEAIGAFQQAARDPDSFMTCCSMLGLCFREKGMPQIAEKWYRKGLDAASTAAANDEHALGLLYDLGTLHHEQGRHEEARNCYVEVYASDANYRDVAARLKLLSGDTTVPAPRAEG